MNDFRLDGITLYEIKQLGISQLYLNNKKIRQIYDWFNPDDLSNFEPLSVYDFGNNKLTITDGHSRAFVAYKHGLVKLPVVYDTDKIVTSEQGQIMYRNDITWCERFNLHTIYDLKNRIISDDEYKKLWIDRCDAGYNLLTQTNESQREVWQNLHENLFLYGASEDLSTLYYEDIDGNTYSFPRI